MARIRSIKPKFWDDIKIGRLSRDARLLYIGLWSFSDDIGVVIGDSIWLKSKVFPYDQIQVQQFEKWIKELVINGFICLLSYDEERFIYLPNFTRHQVITRPNTEDLNIPKELIERLTDINVYLARSGKLLADAKAYQEQVTANVYSQHMEFISRVPATVAIKFVSAQSVTANQLVVWLDRINRTLVHAGDNIRTQISFAKQDLALQRKGY